MVHQARNVRNQRQGQSFEAALAFEASRAGLLAQRNGQIVRWLPGGRHVAVKSNLDWTLIRPGSPPAFVDQKSFAGHRFGRSMLSAHQITLAQRYRQFGCVAGFIVHLREVDAVVFYDVERLGGAGRAGFGASDGVALGCLGAFALAKVWADGGSDTATDVTGSATIASMREL